MGKLIVFVGHSHDARELAKVVVGMKDDLERQLEIAISLDREHPLQSIRMWEWERDAEGRPGGQAERVDPALREAHIGIFVFAERVGEVTRQEIATCLERGIATWGIFPAKPPETVDLAEAEPLAKWQELVRFRDSLSGGWGEAESQAVRPHPRYRDAEDLRAIVLAQFERDVGPIVASVRPAQPARRVVNPDACLAAYRASLRAAHDHPPTLFQDQIRHMSTVFVELDVAVEGGARAELAETRDLTLQALLSRSRGDENAPRWVVLGDPGAGKSTLARHLVWDLAGQHGVLPVYASLPSLVAERSHPFESAESFLVEAQGSADGEGLAELLFERAEQGQVWLLLDGLDEVAPGVDRAWVEERLAAWSESKKLARVPMAVFSRPVGFRELSAYPSRARIRALSESQQHELLKRWLGDVTRASALQQHIGQSPGLRELCTVPLLLSLLALLGVDGERAARALPASRSALYEQALYILLERGHQGARGGVREAQAAYAALAELCLELQESPGKDWTRAELIASIEASRARAESASSRYIGRDRIWLHSGELLDDVAERSGVLADPEPVNPRRRSGGRWSFLHRQFREFLAADALREQGGDEAVLERARALAPDTVPRWAEVLGFACERAKEPIAILRALGDVNEELALRVLPEIEGVDHVEALGVLHKGKDGAWDGDFLLRVLDRWIDQGGLEHADACAWLWRQVLPKRSILELAYVHYALDHVEGTVDRERFFRACEHWPASEPSVRWVPIRAGTFRMGSPEDEAERSDDETPHDVELSAFELVATAVTNEDYAKLDGDHAPEAFGGKIPSSEHGAHPVVDVSWWEAYLYASWVGARLPTEAEWEYACRAGTTTSFSFGRNVTPKQVNYDGDRPYAGGRKGPHRQCTVPVGSLPANAWGLHEMHGNVWEWCGDWSAEYPQERTVDPRGPNVGSERVIRGGSWLGVARHARAAYRDGNRPGNRNVVLGFRLARDPR